MDEGSVPDSFSDNATYDEVVSSLANQVAVMSVDLHVANIRIEKLKARNAELEKLAEND